MKDLVHPTPGHSGRLNLNICECKMCMYVCVKVNVVSVNIPRPLRNNGTRSARMFCNSLILYSRIK